MSSSVLVVPCFDEARRLDRAAFATLASSEAIALLFVDDGSTDATLEVLRAIEAQARGKVRVLSLAKNVGKGEAVRRGMLAALDGGAAVVGYADADLATPPDELVRLHGELREGGPSVVVGSRVLVMGTRIERSVLRHLLGRVFATFTANIVKMPFYDTQCGAKYFRDGPALRAALSRPFLSRWAFDVELLGRLRIGSADVPGLPLADFVEVPLRRWVDIPDSKLRLGGMAKTLGELARIDRELSRLRREAGRA